MTFSCLDSEYKNNLLKERVDVNTQPKVIDLDKGNAHTCKVSFHDVDSFFSLTSICLLQRCKNFLSEEQKKVKMESLAGPEAALCPGRRDSKR